MNRKTDFPSFVLDRFLADTRNKVSIELDEASATMNELERTRARADFRMKLRALNTIEQDVGATLSKSTIHVLAGHCSRTFVYEVIFARQLLTYLERLEKLMPSKKAA